MGTLSGGAGAERIQARLKAAAERATPAMRQVLYRDAGNRMVNHVIPMRFREHGPGWAPSRSTSPLMDTKLMSNSNDWRVEGAKLEVGNTRPQARLMNRGGTVVPKNARFLALPLSPPLSPTEARMNKPRDFAGAFVLMKGPEGPGLYRKTGGWGGAPYARGVKMRGIERIFAFAKKVTIKARPFLYWGPALAEIRSRMKARLMGQPVADAISRAA